MYKYVSNGLQKKSLYQIWKKLNQRYIENPNYHMGGRSSLSHKYLKS